MVKLQTLLKDYYYY